MFDFATTYGGYRSLLRLVLSECNYETAAGISISIDCRLPRRDMMHGTGLFVSAYVNLVFSEKRDSMIS